MTYRKIISNELRFKILKRDNFTCQYCGAKAPDVVLEIDHIRPVSKGGDNRESNLITACFNCNKGKKDYCIPEMENESDSVEFDENFKNRGSRYGYYTNYIAKVIGMQKYKKPVDRFVKDRIKTQEDFEKFKEYMRNNDLDKVTKEISDISLRLAKEEYRKKRERKKNKVLSE